MGNIKATFSPGMTAATVHGLTQWDYGRKLEIGCADLPAIIEVHFACAGMKDAIVRVGSAVSGSVVVTIPDICLEQAGPITAWVYCVDDDGGRTELTLTLPVIARARPSRGDYNPEVAQDSYTELVQAVNEAVGEVKSGKVMVANAAHATSADRAHCDGEGRNIFDTYQAQDRGDWAPASQLIPQPGELYQFAVKIHTIDHDLTCVASLGAQAATSYTSLGFAVWNSVLSHFHVVLTAEATPYVAWARHTDGLVLPVPDGEVTVMFRKV